MSWGKVVCSKCKQEVHQDGLNQSWRHEDKTPRCDGAHSEYAEQQATDIQGDSGRQHDQR